LAKKNIAGDQGDKIKQNFDKNALPHNFEVNDTKLTPKWQGPAKIT